eukprot:scaffold1057_cov203-Skeletonema_marinoi.AAC.16
MVSTRTSSRGSAPQAASPAFSVAQQQSTPQQSQQSAAESATVVPPASQRSEFSEDEEEFPSVNVDITSPQQQDNPTQQTEQPPPTDLDVRVPSTVDVISNLRKSQTVKSLLDNNEYIRTEEEYDNIFFRQQLWDDVSTKICSAIKVHTPKKVSQIKSSTKKYDLAKEKIILGVANNDLMLGEECPEGKKDEAILTIQFLAFEYSKIFHQLITPVGGQKRVPIDKQIVDELKAVEEMPVEEYFNCGVGKHVTDKNPIGKCIASLQQHFVTQDQAEELKEKLPTELVDNRVAFGKLKYPNYELYEVFALVERVYSQLATPTNIIIFGGETLALICHGIVENPTIIIKFKSLFNSDEFDDPTILETVKYYMKTFGNMRLKDLCYRYNSNLNHGAEVGIRQSLVGVAGGGGKRKKQKKSKGAKKRRKKNSQHSDSDHDEDDGEDDNDRANDEEIHEKMLAIAEEEYVDDELKECTIHPHEVAHMEVESA